MASGRKNELTRELIEERSCPEPNTGCWLWLARPNRGGYGTIKLSGTRQLAHRASYEVFVGPVQGEQVVRHSCDTPACVNPMHLEIGTQLDNIRDRVSRGRNGAAFGDSHGARTCPESRPRGELHYASKLTEADAVAIRADRAPQRVLAKRYGVSRNAIRKVQSGASWAHLKEAS